MIRLDTPDPISAELLIRTGVPLEVWINWVDGAGSTIDLTGYHAVLSFSAAGAGETAPASVSDITDPAVVGQITCGASSPNMKVIVPSAATAVFDFRRLRFTLDVTDTSLTKRRWLEGAATLDRGVTL